MTDDLWVLMFEESKNKMIEFNILFYLTFVSLYGYLYMYIIYNRGIFRNDFCGLFQFENVLFVLINKYQTVCV